MPDFKSFPRDFVFGAAASAYQIEGAWDADGKGPSIWDTFVRRRGKILNGDTGDTACDHYHRYREDVALMKEIGLESYRFSINWPRVLPLGYGRINEKGLDFYDRLTDELLAASIKPLVTLYHWDLPQALQDKGGWASLSIRNYFADFAAIVTRKLGDRIQSFITLNEPWMFIFVGNLLGMHAPGFHNPWKAMRSFHNSLCAHGQAVKAMRSERNGLQIGITLSLSPLEPATESRKDRIAMEHADLFMNRITLDPLFGRGYPRELQNLLKMNWFFGNE